MQPLILYANHADFQQTNVIPGIIQQGVGGVTEGLKNRVVIPLTGNYAENNHVIGHELVHAFQYDIMKTRGGISQSARLPLWLVEGMSEYLSLGRQDALTAMWMRDAVLYEDLPSMSQLIRNREYFPYRFGHAVWAYIAGKWGDMAVPELFRAILTQGWNKGFREVLGATPDSVAIEWKNATIARFGPEIEGKTRPGDIGKAIVKDDNGTNLSPVISPDGRYIALLSQRDLFSIDLYLVDAQTGEFIDELVSSNTDAHFDALRFMSSAGAWSPDSKKF
ncbi:MAG: peptidase S9, partial [candidate division Zixibacteria bacterium]|nr:peptidase S9 [candidate division Zixibacteria bacterium]NIR64568.1 peptidase S9 [candidate division Zixibacteria bacterium]NIS16650.1 peptidase S9 [candidate division Zixibacteria bacterium]NIS46423.1 peptidase S9 [candidate division Zixibacteria bacterium]NIT53021.1 peptidase S9 [candidate division Zixibacteria bacterium]